MRSIARGKMDPAKGIRHTCSVNSQTTSRACQALLQHCCVAVVVPGPHTHHLLHKAWLATCIYRFYLESVSQSPTLLTFQLPLQHGLGKGRTRQAAPQPRRQHTATLNPRPMRPRCRSAARPRRRPRTRLLRSAVAVAVAVVVEVTCGYVVHQEHGFGGGQRRQALRGLLSMGGCPPGRADGCPAGC